MDQSPLVRFLAKRRNFGQKSLFIGQKNDVLLNRGPECFGPPEHIHNAPITKLTNYLVKLFQNLLNQSGDHSAVRFSSDGSNHLNRITSHFHVPKISCSCKSCAYSHTFCHKNRDVSNTPCKFILPLSSIITPPTATLLYLFILDASTLSL